MITRPWLTRATIALASYTGWQPSEIGELDFEDFDAFLSELPKRQ